MRATRVDRLQFRSIRSRIGAGFGVVIVILVCLLYYLVTVINALVFAASDAITARDVVPISALEQVTEARTTLAGSPDSQRGAALAALKTTLDQLHAQTPKDVHPLVEAMLTDYQALVTADRDATAADPAGRDSARQRVTAAQQSLTGHTADLRQHLARTSKVPVALDGTGPTIILLLALLAMIISIVGLGWWVSRSVRRPLIALMSAIDRLAAGDLSVEIPVTSRDEIGRMATALRHALAGIRTILSQVADTADQLATSSSGLTRASDDIAASARTGADQASNAAQTATEVSRHMAVLATGAVELDASVSAIARSAGDVAAVSGNAAVAAADTNRTIDRLDASSSEIGTVINVITSIAAQTNLLALNAAIEAARAGEAGRGFAIVAAEVGELARQTARATDDVSRRVSAIQTDAHRAVSAVSSITNVIAQIDEHQTAIAAATEQQAAVSAEMSRNVTNATGGVTQIATAITEAAAAATTTTGGVTGTRRAAHELAALAAELREGIVRFTY